MNEKQDKKDFIDSKLNMSEIHKMELEEDKA